MSELANLAYIAMGALVVLVIVLVIALVGVLIRRRRVSAPAVPEASKPIACLERTGDGDGVRIYPLDKPLAIVGRGEESDVRIASDLPGGLTVSRRHAQIRREDLDFVVEDLNSQNGIKVNGLITRRNLLRDGYHVSFGNVEFIFHQPESNHAARSDS